MKPQDPAYRERMTAIFAATPHVASLGIRLTSVEPGACTSELALETRHNQQDGYVHAGVMATMADHTAGAAAGTLIAADEIVLTVEFKISILRPGVGTSLRCLSQVLRPGRRISFVESEVFAIKDGVATLCAKATVTIAIVERPAPAAGRG